MTNDVKQGSSEALDRANGSKIPKAEYQSSAVQRVPCVPILLACNSTALFHYRLHHHCIHISLNHWHITNTTFFSFNILSNFPLNGWQESLMVGTVATQSQI